MLTCDEQEVSAQLGCLLPISSTGGGGGDNGTTQDQVRGKETEGNHKAQHHHSHRERGRSTTEYKPPSLSQRLETRRLLVQSLLFISSGIILQIFFDPGSLPPTLNDHTCRPPSLSPRPPAAALRGMVLSRWARPRDEAGGLVGLGSAGIAHITLTRSGFEYCSGSWVLWLPFVGKMGSRNGGEWGARTGQAYLDVILSLAVNLVAHGAIPIILHSSFPFWCCFYFFLRPCSSLILFRDPRA